MRNWDTNDALAEFIAVGNTAVDLDDAQEAFDMDPATPPASTVAEAATAHKWACDVLLGRLAERRRAADRATTVAEEKEAALRSVSTRPKEQ